MQSKGFWNTQVLGLSKAQYTTNLREIQTHRKPAKRNGYDVGLPSQKYSHVSLNNRDMFWEMHC